MRRGRDAMEQLLKQRETWLAGRAKLEAWHAQTREEALEPDLEIVDPHHHMWDYRQLMGYNLLGIFKQQYYLADELVDDIVGAGHNVTRTVYAEAHAFHGKDGPDPETTALYAPLGEAVFAQGVAAQFASGQYGANTRACSAIIGSADLQAYGAGIEPLLAECVARCPNFRGVRCSAAHHPRPDVDNFTKSPGLYADAKFREGVAVLTKLGLSLDAWCYAHQLGDVRDLALAFPDATIVLDHAGTPARLFGKRFEVGKFRELRDASSDDCFVDVDVEAAWKASMEEIARACPNVFVKVGGFALPAVGAGFEKRDAPPSSTEVANTFGPFYRWTVETFGADRCMLESNFPVDKVGISYGVLWNAHKRFTKDAGFSDAQRYALFSGTAKRVYKIK